MEANYSNITVVFVHFVHLVLFLQAGQNQYVFIVKRVILKIISHNNGKLLPENEKRKRKKDYKFPRFLVRIVFFSQHYCQGRTVIVF